MTYTNYFIILFVSKAKSIIDRIYEAFSNNPKRAQIIQQFISENNFEYKEEIQALTKKSKKFNRVVKSFNNSAVLAVLLKNKKIFDRIMSKVDLSSLDKIEQYRETGCVVVSYHIGIYTLLPLILSYHGYNVNQLYRSTDAVKETKLSTEKLNQIVKDFSKKYSSFGELKLIDSFSIMSLLKIQKAVRKKEVIVIFVDTVKDSSSESLPISFFKQKIAGHAGIAQLFKITKAPFIPMNMSWENGKSTLTIHDELDLNIEEADQDTLNKIYKLFPELVKKHPEQWVQVESYPELKH